MNANNQNLKLSNPYGTSGKVPEWRMLTSYEKLHLTSCKK
ncbi:hypothetical protein SAMN04488029_2086 [Reichenbachiella faecimaris]|uniref:Uncharacterized protein n=1 Tax=Reichenbachiella faecimaris TaxID=692418 RepID=A0A1W2GDM2_REIFA|nr:hypothetical protein SAMN04488029_2086 [Reichenbachiella faecimaris]